MRPKLTVLQTVGRQVFKTKRLFAIKSTSGQWMISRSKELLWSCAFGSLFIFAQSYALSIQNIQINSALGEPLDAVIHVEAAPGEVLSASCIAIRPGADASLPPIRGVQLSLSRSLNPGSIRLTSRTPMREPMSEIVVHVECPGAPNIQRSFLVMLDPPDLRSAQTVADSQTTTAQSIVSGRQVTPNQKAAAFQSSNPRIRVTSSAAMYGGGQTVNPGGRYIVENGDTLSTIAARVEGREVGTVWGWSATILSSNPHAFISGDPNQLISGSELYIPGARTRGLATRELREGSQSTGSSAETSQVAQQPVAENAARTSYAQTYGGNTALKLDPQVDRETNTPATLRTDSDYSTVNQTGSVAAGQPVFVMAKQFSSLSLARLKQRDAGLIQAAPDNLPNFGQGTGDPVDTSSAAGQTPVIPAEQRQENALATSGTRRFAWLGALGGLGLLALSFLAGLFVSSKRAQNKIQDAVDAKLAEARYHERLKNDHRDVNEKVLEAGAVGGSIQVTESGSQTEAAPPAPEVPALDNTDDPNSAAPLVDNDVAASEQGIDFDFGAQHSLTTLDLELLEQDYAQQENGLEEIASAGQGESTGIMKSGLDLEFPEDVKMRREVDQNFETLDFEEPSDKTLDFDVAKVDRTEDTVEGASLDVSAAGAALDEELMSYDETTEDPAIDELSAEDDEDLAATSTTDAEEFYHLEASSIMNVGELSFEKELDDETKILKFRQRSMKTGTDDSGADEE